MKACFLWVYDVTNDQQLERYRRWYLQMCDAMDQHPDKLSILLTMPIVNPAEPSLAALDVGLLRLDYRKGDDSHPNRLAMETVGPVPVDFVVSTIDAFRSSPALQTPIGAE